MPERQPVIRRQLLECQNYDVDIIGLAAHFCCTASPYQTKTTTLATQDHVPASRWIINGEDRRRANVGKCATSVGLLLQQSIVVWLLVLLLARKFGPARQVVKMMRELISRNLMSQSGGVGGKKAESPRE